MAQRDSERFKDGAPTVFHRRNRESWLVTMRLADWMELYHSGKGGKAPPYSRQKAAETNERKE